MKLVASAGSAMIPVVVLISALTVRAADLNLSITSGGNSIVTVDGGATVDYEITGVLTDTDNEGLALFLFDLAFSGGPLTPADIPVADPMVRFAIPEGISNPPAPEGFGGTVIGGVLTQVGGSQNTINNDILNAPFPLGDVLIEVAHSEVVLVTGSLTAPIDAGTYTLSLSNLSAAVIRQNETGTPFWAVDSAGLGTNQDLTINVNVEALLAPAVQPLGPRYLAVTPVALPDPVALLFEGDDGNPAVACVSKYVQPDGTLDVTPSFQLPDQWGTISVHGTDVIPAATYNVRVELEGSFSPSAAATTYLWGDANNSGVVDLDDILCAIAGFGGDFTLCPLEALDMLACDPEGVIDLDDILAVINGFGGGDFSCADPCTKASVIAPAPDAASDEPPAAAWLEVVPLSREIRPGQSVEVELYISRVLDLRGYQITLDSIGGSTGRLELKSISVDTARPDYLFADVENFPALDVVNSRLAVARISGGVSTRGSKYVGTFVFQASHDARGSFTVVPRTGIATFLRDSLDLGIPLDVSGAGIVVR